MTFDDRSIDYTFDPLKVVDIKTLSAVAEKLKKSNDKGTRAVGVFLDRVNRLRTTDTESTTGAAGTTSGQQTKTTNSNILQSTGLTDLQE